MLHWFPWNESTYAGESAASPVSTGKGIWASGASGSPETNSISAIKDDTPAGSTTNDIMSSDFLISPGNDSTSAGEKEASPDSTGNNIMSSGSVRSSGTGSSSAGEKEAPKGSTGNNVTSSGSEGLTKVILLQLVKKRHLHALPK